MIAENSPGQNQPVGSTDHDGHIRVRPPAPDGRGTPGILYRAGTRNAPFPGRVIHDPTSRKRFRPLVSSPSTTKAASTSSLQTSSAEQVGDRADRSGPPPKGNREGAVSSIPRVGPSRNLAVLAQAQGADRRCPFSRTWKDPSAKFPSTLKIEGQSNRDLERQLPGL